MNKMYDIFQLNQIKINETKELIRLNKEALSDGMFPSDLINCIKEYNEILENKIKALTNQNFNIKMQINSYYGKNSY